MNNSLPTVPAAPIPANTDHTPPHTITSAGPSVFTQSPLPKSAPGKLHLSLVFIPIFIILLLAVGVLSAFLYVGKNKNNETKYTNPTTNTYQNPFANTSTPSSAKTTYQNPFANPAASPTAYQNPFQTLDSTPSNQPYQNPFGKMKQ